METKILERIKRGLLEKRRNLINWLDTASNAGRQVRLGPADETAVHAHIQVLDAALEMTENETLGRCKVCHGHVGSERLQLDYTCCVCIDHYSAEERRQLESELELSQVVQRAFLPQVVPEIPGLDIAVFSRPAQIVGGDYFDFLRFRDGVPGLAIADVAGHGLSTSLLMASVQTVLRTLAPGTDSPSALARRVNRFFLHNVQMTTFVTMFLARLDPMARTLDYCNAGHNPPLLLRRHENATGPACWLQPTAAAVGLTEESRISSETIDLGGRDTLVLYTDGVTEAVNLQREEFGRQRLAALMERESDSTAQEMVEALRGSLQEFVGDESLADDTTIVVCRVATG